MNPTPQSTRVSKLKKRFLDVLSGSVKLESRGAVLFLEGLCAQDDPILCLGAIIDSVHGLTSFQSAMQSDLSVQFMNGLGSTVLDYLLKASDVGGDALDNLLFQLVEPPIFWGVFVCAFQQGVLSEDAQLVFARTLSRLLTLQGRNTSPYRGIAAQPAIQERLDTSSKHEVREMGHLIKHILSSSTTARDAIHGPGGRHDNDFADFRDIAILPTADEILCQKPPFLRRAFLDDLDASENSIEDYLDNTFRMLREDMIYDIRQEVQGSLQKNGKQRGFRVDGVSMVGIHTGRDRRTCWGIELQCKKDFRQLKNMKDEEARLKFLTQDFHGSKILRHQSLFCLASGKDIIGFGTVIRVEELLARKPPVIVLQLDGDANIRKTLASLRATRNVQLIHINSAVFSFEPVLTALKTCSVPLSEEILHWNPESHLPPSSRKPGLCNIAKALTSNPSMKLNSLLNLPKSVRLDEAQGKSLVSGLQQRVSLIQGPPGTGKSFIGAILAKAIHDKTGQTILVVCYTNHALDQFICDLLKYDIPEKSIVRLGGRPNPSTDHLSIRKQPRGWLHYDWEEIDTLKGDASGHEAKLHANFDALLDADNSNLLEHLELNYSEFSDAFYVPVETEDGMTRVGPNGRDIDQKYLISRWILGQDAGVLNDEPHVRASACIWDMPRSARRDLLDKWRQEIVSEKLLSICDDGREYNKLYHDLRREFASSTVSILNQKRIITCTTTGAAIYAEAIAQAAPEVLLVEEAGEILESHILTALSSKVEQMILIGDHKQLRPKVNNYQLTVEKGEGFDLNQSLFERLVLKGYPHETLSMQHRMRPTISAFVRELTYPELKDAPSTYGRPDIYGVQSNIIFVNHTQPEDDNALIGDRTDGGSKTSKQNTYEVEMVLRIVRYLGQHGYTSKDIVVLTPYLGQLHLLRDALQRENDLVLNEMDAMDLARANLGPSTTSGAKAKKNKIHLATIDSYQGEESNIVIASLTRSNKTNAIGFMNSPERLNVLLSRARDGLILIGNSQTFMKSKSGGALWGRFFTLIDDGQYGYHGFPVKCERHPDCRALLARASDFDNHCPDGGCTAPCGFTLACGHTCSMKCHPQRPSALHDPHDASQCKHKMRAKCSAGYHTISWECRQDRPVDCVSCAEEARRLEEIAQKEMEAQKRREEAEAEHCRHKAELEAQLQAEEAAAEEQRRLQEEREARMREEQEREARVRYERQRVELEAKLQAAAEEQQRIRKEKHRRELRLPAAWVAAEAQWRRQEEREAYRQEEQEQEERMQEERYRLKLEARLQAAQAAAEEQQRTQEERLRTELEVRLQAKRVAAEAQQRIQERRRAELEAKLQAAQAASEKQQRIQERHWTELDAKFQALRVATEARQRRQEEQRRKEEEIKRFPLYALVERYQEEVREAERQRLEEECVTAERRARPLITKQLQEDDRAVAIAHAKEHEKSEVLAQLYYDTMLRQAQEEAERRWQEQELRRLSLRAALLNNILHVTHAASKPNERM